MVRRSKISNKRQLAKGGNPQINREEERVARRDEAIARGNTAAVESKRTEQITGLTATQRIVKAQAGQQIQASPTPQQSGGPSITTEQIQKKKEFVEGLTEQQAEAQKKAGRRGFLTSEQRAEEDFNQKTENVVGGLIDPLAAVVERGEQAVAASEPGALRDFNQEALEVAQVLRQGSKLFGREVFKQINRATGNTKALKEKYGEAQSRKTANIDGMNQVIANLEAGVPVVNPEQLFNSYVSNIYGDYGAVKRLTQNDLNAYLEDGTDTLEIFQTSVDSEIPNLQARFNNALAARAF